MNGELAEGESSPPPRNSISVSHWSQSQGAGPRQGPRAELQPADKGGASTEECQTFSGGHSETSSSACRQTCIPIPVPVATTHPRTHTPLPLLLPSPRYPTSQSLNACPCLCPQVAHLAPTPQLAAWGAEKVGRRGIQETHQQTKSGQKGSDHRQSQVKEGL